MDRETLGKIAIILTVALGVFVAFSFVMQAKRTSHFLKML